MHYLLLRCCCAFSEILFYHFVLRNNETMGGLQSVSLSREPCMEGRILTRDLKTKHGMYTASGMKTKGASYLVAPEYSSLVSHICCKLKLTKILEESVAILMIKLEINLKYFLINFSSRK